MLLDEKFIKYLCHCDSCQALYTKLKQHIESIENMPEEDKKLANNLEGLVNEEDEEDDEEVK
jgi:hypothetical protein